MEMVSFGLVFLLGYCGYLVFTCLRFPTPALMGAIVTSGALSVMGYYPYFTNWPVTFAANTAIGIMLARQINRDVLSRILRLAWPVFVQTVGFLLLSLLSGLFLYWYCGSDHLSLSTALISGATGGITEMIIFGMSVDSANVGMIAFIQLVRIMVFLTLLPWLPRLVRPFLGGEPQPGQEHRPEHHPKLSRKFTGIQYGVLFLCALAGALAGFVLRIPTGALLGAMVACGVYATAVNGEYSFDTRFSVAAQICIGAVMGQRITPEVVALMGSLIVPALLMSALMLVCCLCLAFLTHKTTGSSLETCLLCASPGGLTQVAFLADEMGADVATTAVFQSARLISIVAVYPWIVLPLL